MLSDAPVHAVLPCVDIARARKFYEQVLGLKRAELPGVNEEDMDDSVLYECGAGTWLFVYQRPEPTKAEHTAAGWMVADVGAVVDRLNEKGVRMEVYDMPGVEFDSRGVATLGITKGAWFKDTEGNILALTEMP
jgi:catechol 2,3-dioxygenase-like lactoylglutathione lyase family enzyme